MSNNTDTLVERITGPPDIFKYDSAQSTVNVGLSWCTAGTPSMYSKDGILYYEVEIREEQYSGCIKVGFSLENGIARSDDYSFSNVGDTEESWAIDGSGSYKYNNGLLSWPGSWKVGDIIGLAANVDLGMIAVSKNGKWDNNNDDVIKAIKSVGVDFPKVDNSPVLITRAEGETYATKYLKAISDGFLDNSHTKKCHDFVADNVSWDWSDGTKVCS